MVAHLFTTWCTEEFKPTVETCCSVTQSCLTLCEPMDYRMPGFPILHCLPERGLLLRLTTQKNRLIGFPGGLNDKESACNSGDSGSISGLGRSTGEGKGYPLQYSDLYSPWDHKELDTTEWLSLSPCNTMQCNPSGSSDHGVLQVRILEWVTISSSRGFSRPRDRTQVYCIARKMLNKNIVLIIM